MSITLLPEYLRILRFVILAMSTLFCSVAVPSDKIVRIGQNFNSEMSIVTPVLSGINSCLKPYLFPKQIKELTFLTYPLAELI